MQYSFMKSEKSIFQISYIELLEFYEEILWRILYKIINLELLSTFNSNKITKSLKQFSQNEMLKIDNRRLPN